MIGKSKDARRDFGDAFCMGGRCDMLSHNVECPFGGDR
jgi:hypothetical protein